MSARFMTAEDIAEELGCSRREALRFMRELPHLRIGPRTLRLRRDIFDSTRAPLPKPIERWPEHPGVYFVECAGRIKIGVSRKGIRGRLDDLANSTPLPIALMAFAHGDRGLERAYHERFKRYRLHGEWFEAAPAIVGTIGWLRERAR